MTIGKQRLEICRRWVGKGEGGVRVWKGWWKRMGRGRGSDKQEMWRVGSGKGTMWH